MTAGKGMGPLLEDQRTNTLLGWVLVVFIGLVVGEGIISGDYLWAAFAAVVFVLAVIPPLGFRSWHVMLPWEVLLLCVLPVVGRAVSSSLLTTQLATYLAVAGVALVVAVELDVFTTVQMTQWFAVLFVVIATMATAGVWAVVRWVADVLFQTTFILEPGVPETEIEEAVMWEFVYSTAAGILAGIVFEMYFRRRAGIEARLPRAIQERIE